MSKVAFFSTLDRHGGGAATATHRLFASISKHTEEWDPVWIGRFSQVKGKRKDELESSEATEEEKVLAKYQRFLIASNRTKITNTLFSGNATGWDFSHSDILSDCDLINLHWVTELLNPESISRLARLSKPIVWTLHDERTFTGGCHYTFGCQNYLEACDSCPQLNTNLHWLPQKNLNDQIHLKDLPLTFITPSKWLREKLIRSTIYNKERHQCSVIANGVDLEVFKPLKKEQKLKLKKKWNLSKNAFCIAVGGFSLDEDRKGFESINACLDYLIAKVAEQKPLSELTILAYGYGKFSLPSINVVNFGFIKDEAQMAEFYGISDIFVTMTKEDNLPNTVLESLACGTPVLGTRVGGLPEMIEENWNGRLVEKNDYRSMADAILNCLKAPKELGFWSSNARKDAISKYCSQRQASEYSALFKRLIPEENYKSKSLPAIKKIASRIPVLPNIPRTLRKEFRKDAQEWYKLQSVS